MTQMEYMARLMARLESMEYNLSKLSQMQRHPIKRTKTKRKKYSIDCEAVAMESELDQHPKESEPKKKQRSNFEIQTLKAMKSKRPVHF